METTKEELRKILETVFRLYNIDCYQKGDEYHDDYHISNNTIIDSILNKVKFIEK